MSFAVAFLPRRRKELCLRGITLWEIGYLYRLAGSKGQLVRGKPVFTESIPDPEFLPRMMQVPSGGIFEKAGAEWKAIKSQEKGTLTGGPNDFVYTSEDETVHTIRVDSKLCPQQPSGSTTTLSSESKLFWYQFGINPHTEIGGGVRPACRPGKARLMQIVDAKGRTTTYSYFKRTSKYDYDKGEMNVILSGDKTGLFSFNTKNPFEQFENDGYFVSRVTHSNGDSLTFQYNADQSGTTLAGTQLVSANNTASGGSAFLELGDKRVYAAPTLASMSFSYDTTTVNGIKRRVLKDLGQGLDTKTYAYAPGGGHPLLTEVKDAEGRSTQYSYYSANEINTSAPGSIPGLNSSQIVKSISRGTERTDYGFNLSQNQRSMTDANGNVSLYTLDNVGNVTRVEEPLGKVSVLVYDNKSQLTSRTDEFSATTSYGYDSKGNQISETDAFGEKIEQEFNAQGRMTKRVAKNGQVSTWEYDAKGNLIKETQEATVDGQSRIIEQTHTYDTKGQLLSTTDWRGNATTYEYDTFGNQIKVTDAEGGVHRSEYLNGVKVKDIDALGHETLYDYDALGRLIRTTDAKGNTTTIVYMKNGLKGEEITLQSYVVKGQTYETTKILQYAYDDSKRVSTITRIIRGPGGEETATMGYEYDAAGRVIAEKDWNGKVTRKEYDALGRIIKETDPLNHVRGMSYEFTPDGLVTRTTDALGRVTTAYQDKLGRLVRELLPAVSITDHQGTRTEQYERRYVYDASGNQIEAIDERGNVTRFEYDKQGRRIKKTDALNGVFQWFYDANGNVIRTIDENGREKLMAYDKNNRPIQESQTTDRELKSTQTYDAQGNVFTQTDIHGFIKTMGYNELNQMISVENAEGHITERAYTPSGQLVYEKSPVGAESISLYDALGRKVSEQDPVGRKTEYKYDPMGRMIRQTKTWAGAAEGPTSIVTEYTYDDIGRLLTTREGVGTPIERTVTHTYDAVGNQISVVDARGNTTGFAYDALNRMVSSMDANGKLARKAYDGSGNEVVMIDRLGRVSRKTYDGLNRLLTETDALDQTITRTYDGVGNMLTETDRRGAMTTLTYDALNRVLTRTKPITSGGPAIMISRQEYEVEASGRVEATIDGDNHRVIRVYDQDGQVTEERFEDGSKKRFTYDAAGRLTDSFDESNFKTTRAWFADGRIRSITNPNNETTQFTHDIHGEESSTITPLGGKTLKIRDELKRLIAVKQPDGAAQEFIYDGNDNLVSMLGPIQDPSKPENEQVRALFRYTYNKLNRRTRIEQVYDDTSAFVTSFFYDDELNLIRKTDAKGQQTSFTYDDLNREKTRTYAGVTGAFYRGVSENRNYNPNGDLIEVRESKLNPSGSSFVDVTTMDHDLWGRMISKTERGKVIGFQYDNRSNRTRVSTGNGVSTYVHDSKNQLQTVSTDGQTTAYEYYPNGRVKTETHPNGTQNSYIYDPSGQTLSIITKKGTDTLVSFTYEYDRNGNRSKQVEFQKGLVGKENLTTTYIHDSQDRLTGYTEGNRTISYTYDGAHNRLTEKVETGGTVTENWAYAYDYHNRLSEKRSAITNAAEINQYDANGNRTRVTKPGVTQEFLFDSRDVMSLSKEGSTLLGMYDYNFDGMRVRHEGSDRGDVSSFYDGINVLEESIGSDALRYAYGLDTAPISLKSAGGFEYYHQATLGTTTALTDAGGNIKASYRTGPWGDIGEQAGSSANRMIFTSQEHDSNTALIYFGARYYEPGLGRFVSRDHWFMDVSERCLERPVECNMWTYVGNGPLELIDGQGLSYVKYSKTSGTLEIFDKDGAFLKSFAAANNVTLSSNGQWPIGTYNFAYWKDHPESGATGPYGSNGNFVFDVPGRSGMGVHSGRSGPQSLTEGCIRTTDEATAYLKGIHEDDPVTHLDVTDDTSSEQMKIEYEKKISIAKEAVNKIREDFYRLSSKMKTYSNKTDETYQRGLVILQKQVNQKKSLDSQILSYKDEIKKLGF